MHTYTRTHTNAQKTMNGIIKSCTEFRMHVWCNYRNRRWHTNLYCCHTSVAFMPRLTVFSKKKKNKNVSINFSSPLSLWNKAYICFHHAMGTYFWSQLHQQRWKLDATIWAKRFAWNKNQSSWCNFFCVLFSAFKMSFIWNIKQQSSWIHCQNYWQQCLMFDSNSVIRKKSYIVDQNVMDMALFEHKYCILM